MEDIVTLVAKGAVLGVTYGIMKYWNKKSAAQKEGEPLEFKPMKFIKTALIGAVIGGVAGYTGMGVEVAYGNEMIYFAAIVAVEEILKPIRRHLNI